MRSRMEADLKCRSRVRVNESSAKCLRIKLIIIKASRRLDSLGGIGTRGTLASYF